MLFIIQSRVSPSSWVITGLVTCIAPKFPILSGKNFLALVATTCQVVPTLFSLNIIDFQFTLKWSQTKKLTLDK